jgi:tetratricopeptide (TPR) repeat protein
LIPPAFSKVLSIVGFRGDLERGLKMLWSISSFDNIVGALAGIVVIIHDKGMVAVVDIIPDSELVWYPVQKLEIILQGLQTKFPKSKIWQIEQARMFGIQKNLEGGLEILKGDFETPLRQVKALACLERSLQAMYIHDYELSATSFEECSELNSWFHALYHYIAGAAYLELYREGKAGPEKATEMFLAAKDKVGKRKFMARQLPFDAYASKKITGWENISKEKGITLVDAIGVSPLEEMIYMWNGQKKMNDSILEKCLTKLDAGTTSVFLRAVIYRNLKRNEEAMKLLEGILHEKGEDWIGPAAHYEMAVNLWDLYPHDEVKLKEAEKLLHKAAKWKSYTEVH